MKKYLTYRSAAIGECIGLGLLAASIFTAPRSLADIPLTIFGSILVWTGILAYFHKRGYEKGRVDKLQVEINRVWAEQQPVQMFATVPDTPEWTPVWTPPAKVPDEVSCANTAEPGDYSLEKELNQSLAADKAEEPVEWGTDYWGLIEREPSEEHARNLAKFPNTSVYTRRPPTEWVKEPA